MRHRICSELITPYWIVFEVTAYSHKNPCRGSKRNEILTESDIYHSVLLFTYPNHFSAHFEVGFLVSCYFQLFCLCASNSWITIHLLSGSHSFNYRAQRSIHPCSVPRHSSTPPQIQIRPGQDKLVHCPDIQCYHVELPWHRSALAKRYDVSNLCP